VIGLAFGSTNSAERRLVECKRYSADRRVSESREAEGCSSRDAPGLERFAPRRLPNKQVALNFSTRLLGVLAVTRAPLRWLKFRPPRMTCRCESFWPGITRRPARLLVVVIKVCND